jgi:hypothetical protein
VVADAELPLFLFCFFTYQGDCTVAPSTLAPSTIAPSTIAVYPKGQSKLDINLIIAKIQFYILI